MTANQKRGDGPTMVDILYPSVGRQPDGKKFEPSTVALTPRVAGKLVRGEIGPYDEPPAELLNVLWYELQASSVTDYASALDTRDYTFERPEEVEQVKNALLALGFGITMARGAMAFFRRVAKHGPPPHDSASARAALEKEWGDSTDKKVAEVKALVAKAKKQYPGLGKWLTSESGLGNDPQFIAFLHKVVSRRKERSHA